MKNRESIKTHFNASLIVAVYIFFLLLLLFTGYLPAGEPHMNLRFTKGDENYLIPAFSKQTVIAFQTDTKAENKEQVLIISRIKIQGNFPIFKKELRRVINMRIGDEYRPDVVSDVVKKIEGIYKDEGYENVRVESIITKKGKGPEAVLTFNINKGPKTRIIEVTIIDDRPNDKPDIGRFLGFGIGHVFKRKKIEYHIKDLQERLVRLGYLRADVRYLRKSDDQGVRLEVYVYRRGRLNVEIEGNKHFREKEILDVLSFYENRFLDNWEVEESLKRIRDLYLDKGFLDVQVQAVWDENMIDKIEDKHIVFRITEGERTYLKDVVFENNRYIKKKRLKRQFLSTRSLSLIRPRPFKALTFAEDVEALKALYKDEGFEGIEISVETESLNRRSIKKRIIIDEGQWFRIESIFFKGNSAFTDAELEKIIGVSEGVRLRAKDIQKVRRDLNIFYANNGYPHVKITVDVEKDENGGLAYLFCIIDEGPLLRFGRIDIRRNLKTKEKVIRLACTFKQGEPFSYEKILDTQERLYSFGLFSSLNVEPQRLDKGQDHVDCLIEVEEMETTQLNFGAGFSSRAGYRGYMELREDNLWGRAVSGSFRADFSGLGGRYDMVDEIGRSEKYTLTFRDPLFIPRHKVEGEAKLYTLTEDRKEYHTRSNSLSFGIWRPYKRKKLRVGLVYHIDLNRLDDITIDPDEVPERYEEHTISAIGPTIIYDSRDNFMDPHEGIYTNFSLDWAGGWAGGDQDFYKLKAECRAFLPLSSSLVMAFSVRGGYIGLHGDTERVPIQERFFSGGGNTVRGFREDSLGPIDDNTGFPLGGRTIWINNLELRYPIYKNLKGVVFFDAGNVWESQKDVKIESLRQGAGLGLRWITPIGPVRIDYGMAIDREPDESRSRAYLSIGHAF
ncbi:outer membrane protein assembly factor BamA [bacterium]|nr:outer membrane protein assembly factor BamA [bacterium]